MRGYGYDNRTNHDAHHSPAHRRSIPVNSIAKVWTLVVPTVIKSQLITSYSHNKDYNYDPHYGRYDYSSATLDEMRSSTPSSGQITLPLATVILVRAVTGQNRLRRRVLVMLRMV